MGLFTLPTVALFILLTLSLAFVHEGIPTTLDGPFKPVTVPLDKSFRGNAVDLPETDPRVKRIVKGFEPEQISVSLSGTHDSVWISWITGLSLFLIEAPVLELPLRFIFFCILTLSSFMLIEFLKSNNEFCIWLSFHM